MPQAHAEMAPQSSGAGSVWPGLRYLARMPLGKPLEVVGVDVAVVEGGDAEAGVEEGVDVDACRSCGLVRRGC